eukprot:scpid92431/ scgid24913/ 
MECWIRICNRHNRNQLSITKIAAPTRATRVAALAGPGRHSTRTATAAPSRLAAHTAWLRSTSGLRHATRALEIDHNCTVHTVTMARKLIRKLIRRAPQAGDVCAMPLASTGRNEAAARTNGPTAIMADSQRKKPAG